MLKKGLRAYPFDEYGCREIRVIDDTDFACEGDDPFATVQLLLTSKFDVRAINAANFMHRKDSVDKSYDKIEEMLGIMGLEDEVRVCKGSLPMTSESEYEVSEASEFIVQEAMRHDERPLFVVVQGAITNVAVALKTCPEVEKRMHVIWIGGAPYPDGGQEFNLSNDVIAARVVMNSNVGLWQVTKKAYSMMRVSFAELYEKVYPCGKLGKWLCEQLWETGRRVNAVIGSSERTQGRDDPNSYTRFACGEQWQLGDNPVAGLMLNSQELERLTIGAPYINDDSTYTLRPDNPRRIGVYETVDSQFILNDLFARLRYQYME